MKKVLFIAGLYPPISNSGTQRSVKFANYLPDFGWEPIVVTVENPNEPVLDDSLLEEVRYGTRLERIPFGNEVVAKKIAKVFKFLFPEERVSEGLSWRIRSLWSIPDHWAFWRPTVVNRALQIFHNEGFDCIYATGYPWTSFLIARDLSRKTGVPYVLDFRDLWTSWETDWNHLSKMGFWLSKRYESKVMRDAAAIIAVSNTQARILTNMLPSAKSQAAICITNGFDSSDFQVEPAVKCQSDKIRIVYTGVWKSGYSPSFLYDALKYIQENYSEKILNGLELVCAGFPPGSFDGGRLNVSLTELGRVSHGDAIALMKSADILFLPVADGDYSKGHIPGKIFEYLASGKPIIVAAPLDSEVSRILGDTGGATRVDPGAVEDLVKILVDIVKSGGPSWGVSDPLQIPCFERRKLTEKLVDVLNNASMDR